MTISGDALQRPPRPNLPAFHSAAIDLAAQQCATSRAQQGTDRAIAAAVDFTADQRADGAADDQAGGAIVTLAMIAPVLAAPDTLVAAHAARLVIAAPVVVATSMLFLIFVPVIVIHRIGRRAVQHSSGRNDQRSGGDRH